MVDYDRHSLYCTRYFWLCVEQRTQVPVVTVTLENLMAPFTYGASRFLEGIHTGIAIIDDGILRVKDMSDIEERNAELEQKQVAYDELVAENISFTPICYNLKENNLNLLY